MSVEVRAEEMGVPGLAAPFDAQSSRVFSVVPSASRLVVSLRDVGYDFFHAVADLVDNCISAGATRVSIDLRFDGSDSWIRIADDGRGMSGAKLTEALRFGTRRGYGESDLGRFGLGLKTASLSQARRLSVASRTSPISDRIAARVLSLDHIASHDVWEILNLDARKRSGRLIEPLRRGPGTVVLWEDLDRVLNYKNPDGQRARAGFHGLAERLDRHLGMVFHRFLAGEAAGGRSLSIEINGVEVESWDPFARDEAATRVLEARDLHIEGARGSGTVTFQPFVLPPRQRFSSEEAFHRLGGPARWNRQQGFYIYRGDRMIQSGGWSYVRTADEHSKLARAAIDFNPGLDDAFRVNVAKAKVLLPLDLRVQLEPALAELIREAQFVYRRAGASSPRGRGGKKRSAPPGETKIARDVAGHRRVLERAAKTVGELRALRAIAEEVHRTNPLVARQLGW